VLQSPRLTVVGKLIKQERYRFIMKNQDIVGIYEFKSIGDEPAIDIQINEWLQEYPQITVVDIKYQVVPFVEENTLNFASFALVITGEADAPEVNKAVTQQMKIPPGISRSKP
jgi:hypothetical protein